MDRTFLEERITRTKTLIENYEDALLALADPTVMSYTLDTGQSRQVVNRQNIVSLENTLDGLYNRLCTMEARLNGGNSVYVRPGW